MCEFCVCLQVVALRISCTTDSTLLRPLRCIPLLANCAEQLSPHLLPALHLLLHLLARMLLVPILFQLAIVLALPTEPSQPEETSINPRHAVLEKRYNTCEPSEFLQKSNCTNHSTIATICEAKSGAYVRTYSQQCPDGTFCLEKFFDKPEQAICISIIKAVHWATRVGDSCRGVNSVSYLGKKVRMLIDVFWHGAPHAANHFTLYAGHQLIEQAVSGRGGTFMSKPFTLLGGVLTCVYAASAGLDVYAYIRPA